MSLRKLVWSGVLAWGVATGTAQAAAIGVNQWYTFGFLDSGSALLPGKPGFVTIAGTLPAPGSPWVFTLPAAGRLTVVDAFQSGDLFQFFDFGRSLGRTSLPVAGGSCGESLVCALRAPAFSKGAFDLAAGAHAITGIVVRSPLGGGAAAFRLSVTATPPVTPPDPPVSVVPLPSTAPLLALAAAILLGCWPRRASARRSAASSER